MKEFTLKRIATVLLALLVALGGYAQDQENDQPQEEKEKEEEEATQPFGFGFPGQQPPEEQPQQQVQVTPEERQAIENLVTEASPDQRIQLARNFLEQYPESLLKGRAYAALAEAHRMKNQFSEAIENGEKALELSPNDAITMIIVADALAESSLPMQENYTERLARAEDYATRALQSLPELFAGMERREGVPEEEYQQQQNFVEAQAHAVLGYVFLRQHKFQQAEEQLVQALDLVPERPNRMDFLRLGFAHVRQREYKEARDTFQRCVNEIEGQTPQCERQLQRLQRILDRQAAQQPASPE